MTVRRPDMTCFPDAWDMFLRVEREKIKETGGVGKKKGPPVVAVIKRDASLARIPRRMRVT